MTLEIENLSSELEQMVRSAHQRRQQREEQITAAFQKLDAYATDWTTINERLDKAVDQADPKYFRAARPLAEDPIPLNGRIPPAQPPAEATIIATDGSQIMPDRHAAFLYYLINIGGLVYHHGHGRSPTPFNKSEINYPHEDELAEAFVETESDEFAVAGGIISVRRDLAEIETLAEMTGQYSNPALPTLAVLDQRLLYWPIGAEKEGPRALQRWRTAMTRMKESGSLLAGYIVKPSKSSVANLLHILDIEEPGFDIDAISRSHAWERLQDGDLFGRLLEPGQRSKVFVDVSQHNTEFKRADQDNEVCFFYLNPGTTKHQIARVDIPMWVARDSAAVTAVHALIYDQCRILGDYPYVLTRADEIAVVGRQDQAELDSRIELMMLRQGIEGEATAKQMHKDMARQGKTRYEM